MPDQPSTEWTMIFGATRGEAEAREAFARRYEPAVRATLEARWRTTPLAREIDDAVQEVFLDCLRDGGALSRADPARGGFRAFLYGVTRNVALRQERGRHISRQRKAGDRLDLDEIEADEERLSRVFDRAWASRLLERAARLQAERAEAAGADARRRVELLCLRFEDDLPIREIARRWDVEPPWLHHQYSQAREEYKRALREVVREWTGARGKPLDDECRRLLEPFRK